MFRKSLAFILLGASAGTAIYAQTPQPGNGAAATRAFSMFFDGGSYLGVETEEVTGENFAKYGLREVRGAAISKVIDGSPAQSAGLQAGDVVVKLNGEDITSVRKLSRLIGEVAPDHQARLTVLRNGDAREITVTMGKRPAPKFENGSFAITGVPGRMERMELPPMAPMPPMAGSPRVRSVPLPPGAFGDTFVFRSGNSRTIGIGVTSLTKQLSDHFGVGEGVMINNVRKDSPAAKAGMRAGDIIVEVDGKAVTNDFDLIRAIGEKKQGDVTLTIVRDRNRQTINVTPEEGKGDMNTFFEGFDAPFPPNGVRLAVPSTPAVPGTPVPLDGLFMPRHVL